VKAKTTGLKHIIEALGYTANGFKAAYKNEEAVRQEVVVFAILIPAAFWVGRTPAEIVLLVGCCLIVFASEIMNAAVETVVDRIGTERHELSGRAKDLASAAVYVTWANLVMTWLVIGIPRFFFAH
jgi:diacylglycerol kinase (ATP)